MAMSMQRDVKQRFFNLGGFLGLQYVEHELLFKNSCGQLLPAR